MQGGCGHAQHVAASPDPPAIEVDSLTKSYGGRTVLDDVSFVVPKGSVTGFLGPNGAGKTTTLRIVLGLAEPDAGGARVLGHRYADLPHPARQVGAMLEISGFHPGRTGADHLTLAALQADLPLARVAAVLELVELADAADRRVGEYSLGMRQRLGLAGALLGDPDVVILDEPANGLDPSGVRWLREQLRRLADDGRAVLVSSHALAEIQQTADRVVILREGRLIAQDRLDVLLHAAGGQAGASLEDVFFGLTDGSAPPPAPPPPAAVASGPPAAPGEPPPPAATPPPRIPASTEISSLHDDVVIGHRLAAVDWPDEPRIVAVCAAKGGVGCTTIALCLADELARGSGRRVACLDANPAAPGLLAVAGGDPGQGLDEVADAGAAITNAAELAACALRRPPYSDVFGFAPDGPPSALGPAEYATILDLLSRHYEVVVVDVGDSPLAPLGALLLSRAAHVVVPTTADRVATGLTAAALAGLDPTRATLLINGDDGCRLPVEVSAAAHREHARADAGGVAATPPAPSIGRLGERLYALTAGTPLTLPFDRHLADPPWNPGGLDAATALAFKRLAWAVAEEMR